MACEAVIDILVRESGRYIPDQIFRRNYQVSPWMTLMGSTRKEFPRGLGETINVLTYERSAPTQAEPTWTQVTIQDGQEGGACLPPVTKVGIGSTTRNFSLFRRALEGPDFCAEELRSPFEVMAQLNAVSSILAEYSRIEWEIRDRHEYFRGVRRKVVVNGCPALESNTGATTYPASCPTSILTQGILDFYRMKLIRDGAAGSAMGRENGNPILTAIMSAETSDNIIFRNADVRQDFRWAKPSELLAPFGVERSYRGVYHLIDAYPRRFSCAAGVYTEIAAFADEAASKGNKSEIATAWESASYEETFYFDREVLTQMVPKPITNPAPNFRFDPVNYMGVWGVRNILDRICNPDGTILYHRGILAAGHMPKYPQRGIAFVHLRCDPACGLVTSCSS